MTENITVHKTNLVTENIINCAFELEGALSFFITLDDKDMIHYLIIESEDDDECKKEFQDLSITRSILFDTITNNIIGYIPNIPCEILEAAMDDVLEIKKSYKDGEKVFE